VKRGTTEPLREKLLKAPGSASLEELESRLEAQIAAPTGLDEDSCVYYLCTVRCSEPKCMPFTEHPE